MNILVQKFGGTSLVSKNSRNFVIDHIESSLKYYDKTIVVVSALGRKPDPYATDTLLSLINFPNHYSSPRELDLLMFTGEIISSILLTNELKGRSISAMAITGPQAGIITTEEHTRARIKHIHQQNMYEKLQQSDVLVVAGFQGESSRGEITTLGRGGSDITAAAIAASVRAKKIEIYTDVMGVMTADPKVVPRARTIRVANYNEMKTLAYQGAKVIHPRAIEIAMKEKIPIIIKSTYMKDSGTMITTNKRKMKFSLEERFSASITYRKDLSQFTIYLKEKDSVAPTKIFKSISKKGITFDFIYISPTKLTFTISRQKTEEVKKILAALSISSKINSNCSKVSIVGMDISKNNLLVPTIVGSLTDAGISIFQSNDHYLSVSLLVEDRNLAKALNTLHEALDLDLHFIKEKG